MVTMTLRQVATTLAGLAQTARRISAVSGTWARDDRTPELARTLATLSNRQAAIATRCEERLPTIALTDGAARSSLGAERDDDIDIDIGLFGEADAANVDERRGELVRALMSIREIAVDAANAVDPLLDEPTTDVLDDVRRWLDRDLAALTPRSVMQIVPERRRSS